MSARAARPAERRGRSRHRPGTRRGRRAAVLRRLRRPHRRQSALRRRSCWGRSGKQGWPGAPPRALGSRTCDRGRWRPVSSPASPAAAKRRWSWRAPSRSRATGPGSHGRAPSPGWIPPRGRSPPTRSRRRACSRRGSRSASSTRWCARLSTTRSRPPLARSGTPRPRASCTARAPRPSLSPRNCSGPRGSGERWAIEELRLAARRALDRGVPAAADRYLRRALEERPSRSLRAELLAEAGSAARLSGAPDALELLEQAVELTADRVEGARLLSAIGQALLDLGPDAGGGGRIPARAGRALGDGGGGARAPRQTASGKGDLRALRVAEHRLCRRARPLAGRP